MRHPVVLRSTVALATAGLVLTGCAGGGGGTKRASPAVVPAASPGWVVRPATSAAGGAQRLTLGTTAQVAAPGPTATTPAGSAGDAGGPTITSDGTGTVSGTPDEMTVTIGVQTTGAHASDALSQNNAVAAAVQAALARDGVASPDIQTSGLSLYAQQDGANVSGYQASDSVTATLHRLGDAGRVIDDAIAAAGDSGRLDGASFAIDDTSSLLARARQQAVAAARAEAQQLAAAAGVKITGLRSLKEQAEPVYPYSGFSGAAMPVASPASVPVPVQPGSQQMSVQVTAVWDVSS